jgi:hypothetical protein
MGRALRSKELMGRGGWVEMKLLAPQKRTKPSHRRLSRHSTYSSEPVLLLIQRLGRHSKWVICERHLGWQQDTAVPSAHRPARKDAAACPLPAASLPLGTGSSGRGLAYDGTRLLAAGRARARLRRSPSRARRPCGRGGPHSGPGGTSTTPGARSAGRGAGEGGRGAPRGRRVCGETQLVPLARAARHPLGLFRLFWGRLTF